MSCWRLRFPSGTLCWARLEFLQALWLQLVPWSCTKTINFHTYEEEAYGSNIGVLSDGVLCNYQIEIPHRFHLMKFNSSLFAVCEGDGELTLGGDVGPDHAPQCGQGTQCVLAFDLISFSQEQFQLVHVEVEVRNINDHAPCLPLTQIPMEVCEGVAVGMRTPLEVPVDKDLGANGLQSVRLAEPHNLFRVELQTRADGAQCVDLVLLQELDHEGQAAYSLELVAQDRRPPAALHHGRL